MNYRPYNHKQDLAHIQRIWRECGWTDDEDDDKVLEDFFAVGDTILATIDGEAECSVHSTPGTIRYLEEDLGLGAVTAVTTSHIARKSGFALNLTAKMLARQASAGLDVSALGIFDQGFYDKVGYGTGAYEHWLTFDPTTLKVNATARPPKRLSSKDFETIHQATCQRHRGHGAVNLRQPRLLKAELDFIEKPFGLGYFDGPNGELTHYIYGSMKGEYGPYTINWRAYQSGVQLMELLALVKSLGDQVTSVSTLEFGEIQLQDLLDKPFRNRRSTEKGTHQNASSAMAYWQIRILNLESCIKRTRLNTPPVAFNLVLTDPVASRLDNSDGWLGISGNYIVEFGPDSHVEEGRHEQLPTLTAGVGAFSRLWFGIRPASSLAITDDLDGPDYLLKALDESLRLPIAHLGWDF